MHACVCARAPAALYEPVINHSVSVTHQPLHPSLLPPPTKKSRPDPTVLHSPSIGRKERFWAKELGIASSNIRGGCTFLFLVSFGQESLLCTAPTPFCFLCWATQPAPWCPWTLGGSFPHVLCLPVPASNGASLCQPVPACPCTPHQGSWPEEGLASSGLAGPTLGLAWLHCSLSLDKKSVSILGILDYVLGWMAQRRGG